MSSATPIEVPPGVDPAQLEASRLELEASLARLEARALVGRGVIAVDPTLT